MTDPQPPTQETFHTYKAGKGPHFAQVPMTLLREAGKDSYAVAVFAAVYAVAFFTREKRARIPDKEIGELAGCSRNTVARSRNWLREHGWLSWEVHEGEPHLYHVNMTPAHERSSPSQGGPSQVGGPPSQGPGPTSEEQDLHTSGVGHSNEEREEIREAFLEEKPKEIPGGREALKRNLSQVAVACVAGDTI